MFSPALKITTEKIREEERKGKRGSPKVPNWGIRWLTELRRGLL